MGSTGLTLADLPNIFIMIGALISLFVMLVILLRNMEVIGIVGEGREETWPRSMQPPRLLMQRVHIPFTFKVMENEPIGYGGVNCCVSSTVRYWHACWWGAPVRDLHQTLWGTLPEILASNHLNFTSRPFISSVACDSLLVSQFAKLQLSGRLAPKVLYLNI
ncbi:unnamed protein product [Pieris macdunnoughi]|uniref:Uncharacterized protein n=1 Tax=Pieris macdunnoughi TaxID=345717 RepID=A0A821SY60_9NEOP|nr:unnamed protein product [Pieris macdunnoughi]